MEREAFYAMCAESPSYKIELTEPLVLNTSRYKAKKFIKYYNTRGGMLKLDWKSVTGYCPAHVMSMIMRHVEANNFDVHEVRSPRAPSNPIYRVDVVRFSDQMKDC